MAYFLLGENCSLADFVKEQWSKLLSGSSLIYNALIRQGKEIKGVEEGCTSVCEDKSCVTLRIYIS